MGRSGHQAFGVPVGGVMDRTAAQLANWLVGNPLDFPVLEITLLGPHILFDGKCQIAITGADLSAQIDGAEIAMNETAEIANKSVLSFGRIKNGCRAYLAIGGQWETKKWLESSSPLSTHPALTPDSVFQKGSILKIQTKPLIPKRKAPAAYFRKVENPMEIRVTEGPEFGLFSAKSIGFFFSTKFKITPDSNRMGYRLDTSIVDYKHNKEIISSGIVPGTVQVTNAGYPIVLMMDAQTTGGYPRIANVISADMGKLAQMKPGDELRFSLVGMEEAAVAMSQERIFQEGAN